MPKFMYTALDIENKSFSGTQDARDEEDFRRIMRAKNLVPVKFKLLSEAQSSYKMKANEVAEFCRQFSSMLSSGITAVRAMEILKQRDFKPKLKIIYERLHREVQQGVATSEAMWMLGKAFPELLINMFASGEASGQLERVAAKMAVHYEKEHRLNGKVKSAMRYPQILAVTTVVVVLLIFLVVLPEFFEVLKDFELPLITRIVIGFSQFIESYWIQTVIGILVLVAVAQYLLSIPRIRLAFDKLKLRLPVAGKLLKTIYTARFARTLSSLYGSGVSMIRALEITGTILSNKYVESQFPELIRDVRNGEALSESVHKIDGFDNKLPNTILIGEESGRLDSMLVSIAEDFDYEAEMATGALVALMEPLMLVIMAVIIGCVMLAVIMPMMTMYSSIGSM